MDKELDTTEQLSRKGDEMALIAEQEAELDAFINSLEGRLAGFTTEELQDEIWRRMFEPYNKALAEMKDTLDRLAPF